MASKVLAASYNAVGGPKDPVMGADGFKAGPTDAGRYRVARYGRHSSLRYRGWSTFLWRSPVKDEGGKVFVMHNGEWADVEKYGLTRDAIVDFSKSLYGVGKVPNKWVFNGFGHLTVYLYRDRNNNGRLDANERIHGEFIHTTPDNEAEEALGEEVELLESHGCVHVKPGDLDDMVNRRFLRRGSVVVVHRYAESRVPYPRPKIGHGAPYEVHFYPGLLQMCVVGVERL
jgi:hypothetical protein